ncbi:MAG: HAD-IB family phosphatase, partial [Firmicutes bacterium]|nr:HAD-IB family phosphatase [Bacillota bacterium]
MAAKPHLKLAAFDMDGTITGERSSWEYLHRRLGIWEGQAQKYQELFLAGDISYEEFCRLDAAMWRDMPLAQVYAILDEIPLDGSAPKLLDRMLESGAHLVLLSTGLKLLADRLTGSLGFKTRLANELVHREGKLTGDIIVHVSTHPPGNTKGHHLRECMRLAGASPRETVAVGDSAGDLEMFQEAGLAIAV